MSVEERQRRVRQHGYCGNCLARSHRTNECTSSMVCLRCGWFHHTLLHKPKGEASYSSSDQGESRSEPRKNPQQPRKITKNLTKRVGKLNERRRISSTSRNDAKKILQRAMVALERLQKAL